MALWAHEMGGGRVAQWPADRDDWLGSWAVKVGWRGAKIWLEIKGSYVPKISNGDSVVN